MLPHLHPIYQSASVKHFICVCIYMHVYIIYIYIYVFALWFIMLLGFHIPNTLPLFSTSSWLKCFPPLQMLSIMSYFPSPFKYHASYWRPCCHVHCFYIFGHLLLHIVSLYPKYERDHAVYISIPDWLNMAWCSLDPFI